MMKTNARYIHVAGTLKGDTIGGIPISRNAFMNTSWASRMASPALGDEGREPEMSIRRARG